MLQLSCIAPLQVTLCDLFLYSVSGFFPQISGLSFLFPQIKWPFSKKSAMWLSKYSQETDVFYLSIPMLHWHSTIKLAKAWTVRHAIRPRDMSCLPLFSTRKKISRVLNAKCSCATCGWNKTSFLWLYWGKNKDEAPQLKIRELLERAEHHRLTTYLFFSSQKMEKIFWWEVVT